MENTITFIPGKLYKSMRLIYTIGREDNIEKDNVFMLISSEIKVEDYGCTTQFIVETNNGRREFGIDHVFNFKNYIMEL